MTVFIVDIDGTICNSIPRIKSMEKEIWKDGVWVSIYNGNIYSFGTDEELVREKAISQGAKNPYVVPALSVERNDINPNIWAEETMKEFLKEENILSDKPIEGSEILFDLAHSCKASIFFLTGRSDYSQEATKRWLMEVFGYPSDLDPPLIMRPSASKGDFNADCKENLFLQHIYAYRSNETFVFFEDEPDTIKRYAKYGLVLKSPECWKIIGKQ